jgi:signal transduction histidine kinase
LSRRIRMRRQAQRAQRGRNIYRILATSAGLILLVAVALGYLGWRLLAQEDALQRQQTQEQAQKRREQTADEILAGFLRRVAEAEAQLGQMGVSLPIPSPASAHPAVLVRFSKAGVDVQPAGQLLYYPVAPTPEPFDPALFAQTDKLEFQTNDLNAAASALTVLANGNQAPIVRAQALLRLAAVERKQHRIDDALTVYTKLDVEKRMSLSQAPYGLVSRWARCELLVDANRKAEARDQASALVAALDAGEWVIDKETYLIYDTQARELADERAPSRSQVRLAVTQAVETAWNEWELFRRGGATSLRKRLHATGPAPVLAIVNANAERMVAFIYSGEALRHLVLDSPSTETAEFLLTLMDEDGRPLFASTAPNTGADSSTRSLSALELPWRLQVTASINAAGSTFSAQRRNYLIAALVATFLLVVLACYAMARGAMREAAAGRLQSDFVSAVSHEFRSPLTTLGQLTELLAEGRIVEESRRRQYFSVLQRETARLHRLVEDLLDFGRIDAGRRQYQLEPVDFLELVRNGIDEYKSHANGRRIENFSESTEIIVDADREALRCVVRNLVENAVKYSPASSTVWVETGCERNQAVLRVRDEGIGIPAEEQSRIFEKFVRGEAAKKACVPGAGIGLAMVKEIVTMHHGAVGLDSEAGRGSTFMVRLPLSERGRL